MTWVQEAPRLKYTNVHSVHRWHHRLYLLHTTVARRTKTRQPLDVVSIFTPYCCPFSLDSDAHAQHVCLLGGGAQSSTAGYFKLGARTC
jgi:hypothetical protein